MKGSIINNSALFLMVGLMLGSCTQNNSQSEANNFEAGIPIGVAVGQTGNVALVGQESAAGAKIAEKYFNEKGGVNGKQIKLIFQDTGNDESGAINVFQTLISKDKVVGIVGPSRSQQGFAAMPVANSAKVPVLGPSTTAKGIPEIGDFVARVSAPVTIVAPNAIKAALKINPNLKNVAVFYAQDDAYSKSETDIFQQAVKEAGLNTVTVQKFQSTDTDFQTQATSAINTKPDLVIISSLTIDGGNLVRQLRELGYKGLIVGGNGLNTPNVYPVCKKLCDGILVAQAYSPEYVNEINKYYRTAYSNQYKKDPPQFSAQAFTAVQVFVEALQQLSQKQDITKMPLPQLRTELNKQILAGKYETPLGEIAFTPDGEIVQKDFYVAQIKMEADGNTGKFIYLK